MDELGQGEGVPVPSGESWFTTRRIFWAAVGLIGIILVIAAIRARRRRRLPALPVLMEMGMHRIGWRPPDFLRRWAQRARMTPMQRAYAEIDKALDRLGAPAAPADTAAERAAALSVMLPDGASPVSVLVNRYQTAVYGQRRVDYEGIEDAIRALRRLSWRRRLARLVGQV
jgi:hypothetical protein